MSQETCCRPKDGCLPRKNLSKPAFVFMLQIDSHACSGMVLFLESPCEQEEIVMNVNWFKNPDHVVYADMEEFVENFSKETGISNLRAEIEAFDLNPVKEGKILKGRKRTSLKLMIPNMVFDEAIEMGDNVWVYMGETTSATVCTMSTRTMGRTTALTTTSFSATPSVNTSHVMRRTTRRTSTASSATALCTLWDANAAATITTWKTASRTAADVWCPTGGTITTI